MLFKDLFNTGNCSYIVIFQVALIRGSRYPWIIRKEGGCRSSSEAASNLPLTIYHSVFFITESQVGNLLLLISVTQLEIEFEFTR